MLIIWVSYTAACKNKDSGFQSIIDSVMSTLSHLLLVFTDLDGCLLDHFTYDYELARPALDKLKQSKVPLILTSSKTLAELAELSAELKLQSPFIVENGAGVVIPDGYFSTAVSGLVYHQGWWLKCFGPALSEILTTLHKIREENGFRFSGFSDMSSPEVADLTGLSLPRAEMAKQRLFTEPVMWQDSETNWQVFSRLIQESGLCHLRGGRFIHITGGGDKGIALDWLRECYFKEAGVKPQVMALGDSENDIGMLRMADYPVVVRSPAHEPPLVTDKAGLVLTDKTGPAGWNDAVLDRLKKFSNERQKDE